MRTAAWLLTAAMTVAAVAAVDACGDKFLLVGRGLAFGRAYASVYPGSIIVYGHAATQPQLEKLRDAVRKAGHRVAIVNVPADLSSRLRVQSTDIVIAEAALMADLDREMATLASRPSVLYLVTDAEKTTAALPGGAAAVKRGEKAARFLAVIEDIMKARQQAGVRVKRS